MIQYIYAQAESSANNQIRTAAARAACFRQGQARGGFFYRTDELRGLTRRKKIYFRNQASGPPPSSLYHRKVWCRQDQTS